MLDWDIWVVTITNSETGPPQEKPGFYLDGGTHAWELGGSQTALYTAWYLVTQYGKDPKVTELLDTRTIYIMPRKDAVGAEHAVTGRIPYNPRDIPARFGQRCTDPPSDITGNGEILQMRYTATRKRVNGSPPPVRRSSALRHHAILSSLWAPRNSPIRRTTAMSVRRRSAAESGSERLRVRVALPRKRRWVGTSSSVRRVTFLRRKNRENQMPGRNVTVMYRWLFINHNWTFASAAVERLQCR
jgi:hypothetical protein